MPNPSPCSLFPCCCSAAAAAATTTTLATTALDASETVSSAAGGAAGTAGAGAGGAVAAGAAAARREWAAVWNARVSQLVGDAGLHAALAPLLFLSADTASLLSWAAQVPLTPHPSLNHTPSASTLKANRHVYPRLHTSHFFSPGLGPQPPNLAAVPMAVTPPADARH